MCTTSWPLNRVLKNVVRWVVYHRSKWLTRWTKLRSVWRSRDTSIVKVRPARLTDIEALEGMVAYWANMGENLPRSRNELVRDIGSFAVAEHHDWSDWLCIALCVWLWFSGNPFTGGSKLAGKIKGRAPRLFQHLVWESTPNGDWKCLYWLVRLSFYEAWFYRHQVSCYLRRYWRLRPVSSSLVKLWWWLVTVETGRLLLRWML